MSEQTKTRRVVFSFDERNIEALRKLVRQDGGVEVCVHHHTCFPKPQPTGYREELITNPDTGEERIIVLPTFD